MRVVVDTNILVSRYLSPGGVAARVLAAWRAEAFEIVVSPDLLAEVQDVLLRPELQQRHAMDDEQVREAVAGFRRFAVLVEPAEHVAICRDPDDDMFLDCAFAGGASFVVSRDPDLLTLKSVRGVRILSPEAFLAVLDRIDDESP